MLLAIYLWPSGHTSSIAPVSQSQEAPLAEPNDSSPIHADAPETAYLKGRFAVAGVEYEQVRSFLEALQAGIRTDDAAAVAALVEYPLRVNYGSKQTRWLNGEQVIQGFSDIFTPDIKQAVLNQRFEDLFANWRGVKIGNGELWLAGICDRGSPPNTCQNLRVRLHAINKGGPYSRVAK